MNTKKLFRHGDLLIEKVGFLPSNIKKVKGKVLAEGEATGHKHELIGNVQLFRDKDRQVFFKNQQEVELVHPEHKTIIIPPGFFEVTRQQEYSPIGNRLVMD